MVKPGKSLLRVALLVLVLSIVCLGTMSVAIAGHRCDSCGKEITEGRYVVVDGKYFHAEHFCCSHCGRPITNQEFVRDDGRYYHQRCYTESVLPRCAVCGEPISGTYTIHDGQPYHNECYSRDVALRCDYCGQTIEGEYLEDFWGNTYHAYHQGEVPECSFCGRFISWGHTDAGRSLGDGRYICGLCEATAVTDPARAEALVEDVRRRMAVAGIDVDQSFEVKLATWEEIEQAAGGDRRDLMGYTNLRRQQLFGVTVDSRYVIYLLSGMPRVHFLGIAAHELMHVWQFANAPLENDPAFCEGSCNYASYLVLRQLDSPEARYQLESLKQNQDLVYGDGFRRVSDFVDEVGVEGWLYRLADMRYLPPEY